MEYFHMNRMLYICDASQQATYVDQAYFEIEQNSLQNIKKIIRNRHHLFIIKQNQSEVGNIDFEI